MKAQLHNYSRVHEKFSAVVQLFHYTIFPFDLNRPQTFLTDPVGLSSMKLLCLAHVRFSQPTNSHQFQQINTNPCHSIFVPGR